MKKLSTVFIFFTLWVTTTFSQSENVSYSFASNDYIEKCTDIPAVRKIQGGTVFKITYEGKWSNEMQGAFEYACKIWEENLPPCLPINITARIDSIRDNVGQNILSKIAIKTSDTNSIHNTNRTSPTTQIKAVILDEYHAGCNYQFVDFVSDTAFFNSPDITITYNQTYLSEFSYSLYSTPSDKYDFITLVLRDIAKGLGFYCEIDAKIETGQLIYLNPKPTPFEALVINALNATNPRQAYINATKGSLPISRNCENLPLNYGTLKLYAPSTWQNGVSLNTFIPTTNKKITQLLSYEFGKGSVIRDIADNNYSELFREALSWDIAVATGTAYNNISTTGTTENIIPYKGEITVSTETKASYSYADIISPDTATAPIAQSNNFDYAEYCYPYNHFYLPQYPNNHNNTGWSVSILKKDGTWDVVYTLMHPLPTLNINMDNLNFHENAENYARTCDGHLRCRITQCLNSYDAVYQKAIKNYSVYFYAIDFLPQRPNMKFAGVILPPAKRATANEYMRDIKIDIKNLEGTERIIVEQLDEGDRIPHKYEVSDFKKGYFIATVDKELYSQFSIIAYNKNGNTRSETLIIEPLEPVDYDFNVQISDNTINIENTNSRISSNRKILD